MKKYGDVNHDISNDVSELPVSLRCGDWLISTPDWDRT